MHPLLKENKCVKQNEKMGCGVACAATILNLPYEEVSKCFSVDFENEGVAGKLVADFLAGFGFSCIWKASEYYSHYHFINKQMLTPFADIHMISVQQFSDDAANNKPNHAILMNKDGILLDPDTGEIFDKSFIVVDAVFGFWYPKDWKGSIY